MRELPDSPSMEHLKGEAKDILRAHRRGDFSVCPTLRWLPRLHDEADESILASRVSLQEIQHALAMDYGFHSWSALCNFVTSADVQGGGKEIHIPDRIQDRWQTAVDALARAIRVPTALVMVNRREDIEVFLRSRTPGNPYRVGDKEQLIGSGLYCERVISTKRMLLVPDAPADPEWKDNPDVKLGMVSYLGFPLLLPNGDVFGTICVLDTKEHQYSSSDQDLLLSMRRMIEAHLELLFTQRSLEWRRRQLVEILEELRLLHGLVSICCYCRCVETPEGDWQPLDGIIRMGAGIEFSHGICPKCMDKVHEQI